MKKAVALLRVSSTKQGLIGDSPDEQKEAIIKKARQLDINPEEITYFDLIQSASREIQPAQQVIDYCKLNPKIEFCLIKCIDRLTRGGAYFYIQLKGQLIKYDVKLVDVAGVISSEIINTLDHLGLEFSWSKYSPSYRDELLEAEDAKSEVRKILTRMIGAEARYVRKGYRIGPSNFGYKNTKVETEDGLRTTMVPDEKESAWIISMFNLKTQGNISDDEVVAEVNSMGFKSRLTKFRDKHTKKVIGYSGGVTLTKKQMLIYISNPVYCGIDLHKWKKDKPLQKNFEGLVKIEVFNKANRGKNTIVDLGNGTYRLIKNKVESWQLKKDKNNPEFPYKNYVLCPICREPLSGSASRSKSGKHIPAYHCSRKHKYWGTNRKIFNETVFNFVKNVKFSDTFIKRFREIMLEEWEKRREKTVDDNIVLGKRVTQIEMEQKLIITKIKMLSSELAIRAMEDELAKLDMEKTQAISAKNNKEDEQVNIQTIINYVYYFMEHLEDLVLAGSNPLQNAAIFGLFFEELPTYDDLKFGTPKLSCLFKLNDEYKTSKEISVIRQGLEP